MIKKMSKQLVIELTKVLSNMDFHWGGKEVNGIIPLSEKESQLIKLMSTEEGGWELSEFMRVQLQREDLNPTEITKAFMNETWDALNLYVREGNYLDEHTTLHHDILYSSKKNMFDTSHYEPLFNNLISYGNTVISYRTYHELGRERILEDAKKKGVTCKLKIAESHQPFSLITCYTTKSGSTKKFYTAVMPCMILSTVKN